METKTKLKHIQKVLEEMKGEDVVVIDASHRTILADAFVVVTATSDTHARAIADRIHMHMKEHGVRAEHAEQDAGREWTIMDFGDIVLHIFLERARKFYNLEELWGLVREVRGKHHEAEDAEKAAHRPSARRPRRPISAGMARLAEETRRAKGTRATEPTYRSGAKSSAKKKKSAPKE